MELCLDQGWIPPPHTPPPRAAVGPNNKRALVLYKYLNLAHEKLNLVPKMPFKTMKEPKKPHK